MKCHRPDCPNEFTPSGRRKYCCHGCNILYLNRLRTPEYNAKHWAAYYAKNADYLKAKSKNRRAQLGREALNAIHRKWYHSNPGCLKQVQANRRAGKDSRVASDLRITKDEWDFLVKAYDHKCSYCKQPSSDITQDHMVPLSKGGTHTLDNITPASKSCNSAKGSMDLEDFLVSEFLLNRKRMYRRWERLSKRLGVRAEGSLPQQAPPQL